MFCPVVARDPDSRLAPLARVLELTYTAWDLKAFAEDCDDGGPAVHLGS